MYNNLIGNLEQKNIEQLYNKEFTVQEIEKLKGKSKSSLSRKLNKKKNINK